MPTRKSGRKLRIRSKAQQRFVWGVLVKKGKVPKSVAKSRSKKGKNFKKLPNRVKRRKK
jgi:hypothetical protein